MNDDFRFLRDRTAFWLGIKCLKDRGLISITDNLKAELHKTKEFFRNSISANADERTKKYYKTLDSVILGERV